MNEHERLNRIAVALRMAYGIEQLREENKQLRRAVAVAPELLLCLTEVLDADGDLYVMDFDRYRAAIAKAEKEILEHKV